MTDYTKEELLFSALNNLLDSADPHTVQSWTFASDVRGYFILESDFDEAKKIALVMKERASDE